MEKFKQFCTEKREVIYKIVILIILAVGIFIRLIAIDKIPIGINVDEAGTAYDAYCIANYGVDRFLYHNPVYTINYGGGQSVLYTYLAAGFIKLFGFHLFAVRLPAFFLSVISMVILYLMVREFKNKKLAMICLFIIVIVPWHFMQSRWGLDCNLMSPMLLISVYMLLKAKHKWNYVFAGILFGITLYSYALSYIIIPILLLGIFTYLFIIKKIKIMDIICFGIPLFVLALPLILNLCVNKGWIEPIQNSLFSTPKLWAYRGEEVSLGNMIKNIWPILKSMFGYDINEYNAFPQFGTLYYISIPFFVIGIVETVKSGMQSFKKREINLDIIFIICFISTFLCLLLIEGVGISKANGIYIPMIYFIAVGICEVVKNNRYSFILIMILYLMMFCMFQYYYFFVYGKENPNASFNQTTIEAVQYIESNEKFEGKKVNIRTTAIQPYIYTLIANQTSPYEFKKDAIIDGIVYQYGRYIFYKIKIYDDAVYVISKTDFNLELRNVLLARGFEKEEFKDLEILYQTIEH